MPEDDEGNQGGEGGEKTFSQADIDRAAAKARDAGRKSAAEKYADYDEIKTRLADLEDSGKSELEKMRAELSRKDKAIEAALGEVKALSAFKTETEVARLKAERCEGLKMPAWYADLAKGETAEEIDDSLKWIHSKAGGKSFGTGGGSGAPPSTADSKTQEIDARITELEKQRVEAAMNRDHLETSRLSQELVSLRMKRRGG